MVLISAAGSNDQEAFKEALFSTLSDFYNKEEGTNLDKLYDSLAKILTEHDRDISALLHDNFLSVEIVDELIDRGLAKDRLLKEGVFQIDRIGFTPTTFVRVENHNIDETATDAILEYIPVDPSSVLITSAADRRGTPISIVTAFDAVTNTVTVTGVVNPGNHIFEYTDTGNLDSTREELTIPAEVFALGFSEGGFGNFGFGV